MGNIQKYLSYFSGVDIISPKSNPISLELCEFLGIPLIKSVEDLTPGIEEDIKIKVIEIIEKFYPGFLYFWESINGNKGIFIPFPFLLSIWHHAVPSISLIKDLDANSSSQAVINCQGKYFNIYLHGKSISVGINEIPTNFFYIRYHGELVGDKVISFNFNNFPYVKMFDGVWKFAYKQHHFNYLPYLESLENLKESDYQFLRYVIYFYYRNLNISINHSFLGIIMYFFNSKMRNRLLEFFSFHIQESDQFYKFMNHSKSHDLDSGLELFHKIYGDDYMRLIEDLKRIHPLIGGFKSSNFYKKIQSDYMNCNKYVEEGYTEFCNFYFEHRNSEKTDWGEEI